MILGMTRAELGLTVFVFLLIYGAGFLSRLGKVIGGLTVRKAHEGPSEEPARDGISSAPEEPK